MDNIAKVLEELRTLAACAEDIGPSGGMRLTDIIKAVEQLQDRGEVASERHSESLREIGLLTEQWRGRVQRSEAKNATLRDIGESNAALLFQYHGTIDTLTERVAELEKKNTILSRHIEMLLDEDEARGLKEGGD